ncbi:MAG: single-stranded DNA-binding protein [Planctomycetota bacterium]|nr:MAG: single-stranded DNA-binding protein [Planctomycetota bacterium]
MKEMIQISRRLSRSVTSMSFAEPVTHVYNPLQYARRSHEAYLERFAKPGVQAILLGMNPGPWGMAQTGIPFGEVALAKDWLGLAAKVDKPEREHPKRPVQGFDCPRSEVSGRRLWGWAKQRFGKPEKFFEHFFVYNFCPLSFMEKGGRNRTPDKLPKSEKEPLFAACDQALRACVESMQPEMLIGVGAFARQQAKRALNGMKLPLGTILHPSPASPAANRGWEAQAEAQLKSLGLRLPF